MESEYCDAFGFGLSVENFLGDHHPEDWVWDRFWHSPDAQLSPDLHNAYFHIDPEKNSKGTAGVRGSHGFTEGEHYWEIVFLEPPAGTSVMVGVGTEKAQLHVENYRFIDLIGCDNNSWGLSYRGSITHGGITKQYCEPFFHCAVIGCYLNLYKGTLSFFKDGVCLGIAFRGLDKINEPLYPMISSTCKESELGIGAQSCRYLSLQEKCFQTIRRNLRCGLADGLPLPNVMIQHIKNF